MKRILSFDNKLLFALLTLLIFPAVCMAIGDHEHEVLVSRNIEYRAVPDHRHKIQSLKLDVYRLQVEGKVNRPVIILVHGGGFGSGDKGYTESQRNFYPDMAKAFAGEGYVAFSVNYRLWPDCPADSFHIELDNAVSDVLQAVKWIKGKSTEYGIDTAKIIIGGDSAGGGLAVNVACCNAQLFSGCIDMWGGLPPYGISKANENPVNVCKIGKGTPPICIIHGTADDVIAFNKSVKFSDLLTAAGIYNELHQLAGAGHYPIQLANKVIDIALAFSNRIIEGEADNMPGNRVISNGVAARNEYAANVIFEDNSFDDKDVVIGPGCKKSLNIK